LADVETRVEREGAQRGRQEDADCEDRDASKVHTA